MPQLDCAGVWWRRLLFYAIIGFLVIFLSGPVIGILAALFSVALAVVGLILPFVLLGLLIWLPLRWISRRPTPRWAEAGRTTGRFCRGVMHVPLHASYRAASVCRATGERVSRTGRFIATVVTEVVCGALVGGLLGYLSGFRPQGPPYPTVVLAMTLGGLLGVLLAVCRCRSEHELSAP
jgi:hypothetical protein